MSNPVICQDLIVAQADIHPPTAEQVITLLCERMVDKGYVDSSYRQAVLDRERQFPTGLPTLPYPTAIPHADADGVKQTGVAVAVLNHPVPFQAMDSPDKLLDTKIVLLLAVANSANQVSMLQWVCGALQDQAVVKALASAQDPAAVFAILSPLLDRNT